MLKTFADYGIIADGSGEIYTTCPECSPNRKKKRAKCLGVNVEEGVWICHHCGYTGSLGGKTNYLEAHWHKPEYRKPERKPSPDLPDKVISWFAGRGITPEVLIRNKIGYDSVYMPQEEEHVNAIAFPYYRGDDHINTKWRDGKKNFRLEAGAELCLYGLNDIQGCKQIIWVEGEIDKLSLEVAGFKNCVSVPNGAPPANAKDYASRFDWLDLEEFDDLEHILFFDADEPGVALEQEMARRLGKEHCKRVVYPEGYKDANEILVGNGADFLRECVENAKDFPIDGLKTVDDFGDDIDNLYKYGRERGIKTGWMDVDELYSVRAGEFTVITGIPNSGKSNWLDNLIINLAKDHGWRFGLFSPENQPLEEHASGLIEKYSGMPFEDGPTPRLTQDDLQICKRWVNDHFSWVLPEDDGGWDLDSILNNAKYLVKKKGIKGFVLDPWNEIEHLIPSGMTETNYISKSLGKIRRFARANNVHFWIVAHPTKLRKLESGDYEIPTPYDISGSANWRNKADNCITVYRYMQSKEEARTHPKPVEIHIQKIRFRHIGHIGMAQLDYDHVTSSYKTTKKVFYGNSDD